MKSRGCNWKMLNLLCPITDSPLAQLSGYVMLHIQWWMTDEGPLNFVKDWTVTGACSLKQECVRTISICRRAIIFLFQCIGSSEGELTCTKNELIHKMW